VTAIDKKGDHIMKTKIFTIFILVAFACLPLKALAWEHNFPAGSIIIPMDGNYQPEDDGGQLEAYGLAYYLLDHQDPACLTDDAVLADVSTCQADCNAGDAACRQACVETVQEASCEHTVAVSWVINGDKTEVDGIDLVIEVTPSALSQLNIDAVVEEYDHAGGTTDLPSRAPGDTTRKTTYRGSLFVIDVHNLAAGVEDQVKTLINGPSWDNVNVHVAQVPFAAPVHREMRGTPPKIALMNNDEDKTKGNAAILESYLRLAGICNESYEIVTPNEIAGLKADLSGDTIDPALGAAGPGYDFLWAPHWVGEKKYDGTGGYAHQDDVVEQVGLYLQGGKGMLAECASIETFEHNPEGHFLADKDFGHNGVDVKGDTNVLYTNVYAAYSQIGNSIAGYVPEGGHLHNWRPYQAGDPYNFDDPPNVLNGNSAYNNTVKRFTIDDSTHADSIIGEADDYDWDYFVGGYAYGNNDYGYVVYLGGHRYAECKDAKAEELDLEVEPEPNIHNIQLEFTKAVVDADFTLQIDYTHRFYGSTSHEVTAQIPFASDNLTAIVGGYDPNTLSGSPLQIDFTSATVDNKKFEDIIFRNTVPLVPLEIDTITLAWTGGDGDLKIKKLIDSKSDVKHYDVKEGSASVFTLSPDDFLIDGMLGDATSGGSTAPLGCTENGGCEFKNLAGVRYVLNTLFNIRYEQISREYVRSAPVVSHPWLYQGSFEYPSYTGHFRRFNVEADTPEADWDTAAAGKISDADAGNSVSGSRKVYTAVNDSGDWSTINFDAANVDTLMTMGLSVDPDNNSTADEIKVIERLRGRDWDDDSSIYVEQAPGKKLGGIMHSAPVIVRAGDSRVGSRSETAYVGDVYGMLHAIDTSTGNEKWAYIPSNLLGYLENDRSDPEAESPFAAVDGSPTAKDIYWDRDGGDNPVWRTILVSAQGAGGNSIVALDVTDPDTLDVLWEATGAEQGCTPIPAGCDPTPCPASPGTNQSCRGGDTLWYCDGNYNSKKDTCSPSTHWQALQDCTAAVDCHDDGGAMGYSSRAALDKVKVPKLDGNDDPISDAYGNPIYEVKWMVYVATKFVDCAEHPGGINVYAFDLETGTEHWRFSYTYTDSINDIPGAVTTYDIDDDTLADRLFVGDMNGRMWEIALTDDPAGRWTAGQSVHIYDGPSVEADGLVNGMAIPLFSAGIGHPISVSPAIITREGHVRLVFGTGGSDFAANDNIYHVYGIDATAAGRLTQTDKDDNYIEAGGAVDLDNWDGWFIKLTLAAGEKVWSSPTIAAGQIWIVTSTGSMESDVASDDTKNSGSSKLRQLDLSGSLVGDPISLAKKIRGSIFVSRRHLYMTTIDNEIIQIGDGTFAAGTGNRVVLKSWRHQ
jgi:hypothetical protein